MGTHENNINALLLNQRIDPCNRSCNLLDHSHCICSSSNTKNQKKKEQTKPLRARRMRKLNLFGSECLNKSQPSNARNKKKSTSLESKKAKPRTFFFQIEKKNKQTNWSRFHSLPCCLLLWFSTFYPRFSMFLALRIYLSEVNAVKQYNYNLFNCFYERYRKTKTAAATRKRKMEPLELVPFFFCYSILASKTTIFKHFSLWHAPN